MKYNDNGCDGEQTNEREYECDECGVYDFEEEDVQNDLLGDDGELDEEGDIKPRRGSKKFVAKPSAEEVIEHSRTHIPYRVWCPHCVAGRGTRRKHPAAETDPNQAPELSFDYAFLRNATGAESAVVIVAKDKQTKMLFAHVVPQKGGNVDWATSQTVTDIERCGYYGKVVLRGDQEPAITDYLREVARKRYDLETVLENSPVDDSESNGRAERAVRSIEEFTRVFKLSLEARAKCIIEPSWAIFDWLIEHVADVQNKCLVGADGMTAYQRVKGKRHRGELLPFGSRVLYRTSGKVKGGIVSSRWFDGIWLGKRFTSEEHMVARLSDGLVFRARDVKESTEEITKEDLLRVVGRPWNPTSAAQQERDVREVPRATPGRDGHDHAPSADEPSRPVPRSMYIRKDLLTRFGYTPGCNKCRHIQRGMESTGTHTAECRKRLEELIQQEPDERERLERARERRDRFLAEEIERVAKSARQAPSTPGLVSSSPAGDTGPEVPGEIQIPAAVEEREDLPEDPIAKRQCTMETSASPSTASGAAASSATDRCNAGWRYDHFTILSQRRRGDERRGGPSRETTQVGSADVFRRGVIRIQEVRGLGVRVERL